MYSKSSAEVSLTLSRNLSSVTIATARFIASDMPLAMSERCTAVPKSSRVTRFPERKRGSISSTLLRKIALASSEPGSLAHSLLKRS